ncbi:MAG: phosphoglycerate kinase [Roseovarius sp.]|nr:phosphoglycerate kinase [Roseovarius sp.]
MNLITLDDIKLEGKIVLTRVDLNVPLEKGRVTDTTRIDRISRTVADIIAKGGKPMLISHFGRPGGKISDEMSLRKLIPDMEACLGIKIQFIETLEGAEMLTEESNKADALLLENIRFHPGEEANDKDFARRLAGLGDIYCNDAFSTAHRAHASTEALARLMPACAGRLMQDELKALDAALGSAAHPVLAVVGGSKISTKIGLLKNLASRVDKLVIGGGMANTFLAALKLDVGNSLFEPRLLDIAGEIMAAACNSGCEVILPSDVVVADRFSEDAMHETVSVDDIPSDMMALDVGAASTERITRALDESGTLIWNGPLGAFEIKPFDAATRIASKHAAMLSKAGKLVSVAGGGDTAAALNKAGAADGFNYISTAGGAFLEWMEGRELPGVAALQNSRENSGRQNL